MVIPGALAAAQFSVWQSGHISNKLLLIRKCYKGLPAVHSVKWFVFSLLFHIYFFQIMRPATKQKRGNNNLNPLVCIEVWQSCVLNVRNWKRKRRKIFFFLLSIVFGDAVGLFGSAYLNVQKRNNQYNTLQDNLPAFFSSSQVFAGKKQVEVRGKKHHYDDRTTSKKWMRAAVWLTSAVLLLHEWFCCLLTAQCRLNCRWAI